MQTSLLLLASLVAAATGLVRPTIRHRSAAADALAFAPDGRRLAAASPDAPVYVWDLLGNVDPIRTGADQEGAWTALAGTDAAADWCAIRRLTATPAAAVPLLESRLRPATPPGADFLRRQLALLDSPRFRERAKAEQRLAREEEWAAPALRRALADQPGPEVRHALERLLTRLDGPPPPPVPRDPRRGGAQTAGHRRGPPPAPPSRPGRSPRPPDARLPRRPRPPVLSAV